MSQRETQVRQSTKGWDCSECGRHVENYYPSRGMCRRCYKAWKRSTDPDYADRDRGAAVRWKDRNREANRERDRATKHRPCPNCGGPRNRQHARCMNCRTAEEDARRQRIVDLWGAGASMADIADALGTTANAIGSTMVKMRRDGWDLPYRYAVRDGRRVTA